MSAPTPKGASTWRVEPECPVSWLRPRQFSEVTGMGRRTVYDELESGRLRGVQVRKCWYIRADEIEAYFQRNGERLGGSR